MAGYILYGPATRWAEPTPAGVHDSISRVCGAAIPLAVFGVTLGGAVTGLEPFTTLTITATITGTDSGGVTYSLTQTAGPPCTITGSGPTWTYRTPGVPGASAQTRFTVAATKSGFTAAAASVDHYIYPAPVMDYDARGAARGMSIDA